VVSTGLQHWLVSVGGVGPTTIHEQRVNEYLVSEGTAHQEFRLTHVEPAAFTDPLGADEPKFPNTDIPKTCPPTDIPDRFRVGLTVGNFGSMAPWGLYEYASVDSIHVLGGTPNEQMAVVSHGLNVDSMDSYTLGVRAQYGMWDGVAKDAPDGWDYKKRLQESLTNYVQAVN